MPMEKKKIIEFRTTMMNLTNYMRGRKLYIYKNIYDLYRVGFRNV